MNAKYNIYYLSIVGNGFSKRVDINVDDVEKFRRETAETFKVPTSKVKLKVKHLDEKWDDLKHPIPLEK